MTKTLTEQWREGTLPLNHYYVKTKSGRYGINHTVLSFDGDKPRTRLEYSDRTEEVLASVPTYAEFKDLMSNLEYIDKYRELLIKNKQLEKRLEIATNALKDYANSDEWELVDSKNVYWSRKRFPYPWRIAGKALKEMEGVK